MASLSPLMEEVLSRGGTVELTVTGVSMQPMLINRISCIRLAPITELCRGDIPLYRRENGQYVLHRITAVKGETYSCCGDRQYRLERGIRRDQMLAVVTSFCRRNRWISCENTAYRLYWRFWLAIRPLRSFFSRAFGPLKRTLYRLR